MADARKIEAAAQRSAKEWQRFENAEPKWQHRARVRLQMILDFEQENSFFKHAAVNFWRKKIEGLDERDWLPALLGAGQKGVDLFQNRNENLEIVDTICGLLTAIDTKIDSLLKEDQGDCSYLRDQAAHYFEIADTLRKARTQAEKLKAVTL